MYVGSKIDEKILEIDFSKIIFMKINIYIKNILILYKQILF